MSTHQAFVDAVEAYIEKTKLTPTQFGIQSLKDPSFVLRLRNGRSPSARTMDRVWEFMARDTQAVA